MAEDDLPFHRLTKTERQYLLLVHRGYTSRDIAIERGVRSDSVDKVLRIARRKLGDFDRRELATRLIAAEARQAGDTPDVGQARLVPPAQFLGVQSPKLDQTPEMAPLSAPTQSDDSRSNSPPRDAVTILAVDQIIEPALRATDLSRTDFDMLIDIHVANLEGRRICMWDVCQTASVPFSTAHRRLSAMIDRGFVERLAPRGDWRRVIVGLSDDARAVIDRITAALMGRYEISRVEGLSSVDDVARRPRAMEA